MASTMASGVEHRASDPDAAGRAVTLDHLLDDASAASSRAPVPRRGGPS